IENPEFDPQTYGQLIFDKAGKTIQWNEDSLISKWCWENWTAICRKMTLDHFLTPYTKISSKWMKDGKIRHEAIQILEEKAGKNLFDLGCSNFLLNTSPEARETKAKRTM
ncbi:LIN1 transcriptase, partial [Crocuta crocuta]